ncbi:hypothetical protein C8J57DRAFT_1230110 [Mycena rebaudengoi]|nr:hypothetical protein C8J57DRAFT_1230110 [Mycena rebaudengoi]
MPRRRPLRSLLPAACYAVLPGNERFGMHRMNRVPELEAVLIRLNEMPPSSPDNRANRRQAYPGSCLPWAAIVAIESLFVFVQKLDPRPYEVEEIKKGIGGNDIVGFELNQSTEAEINLKRSDWILRHPEESNRANISGMRAGYREAQNTGIKKGRFSREMSFIPVWRASVATSSSESAAAEVAPFFGTVNLLRVLVLEKGLCGAHAEISLMNRHCLCRAPPHHEVILSPSPDFYELLDLACRLRCLLASGSATVALGSLVKTHIHAITPRPSTIPRTTGLSSGHSTSGSSSSQGTSRASILAKFDLKRKKPGAASSSIASKRSRTDTSVPATPMGPLSRNSGVDLHVDSNAGEQNMLDEELPTPEPPPLPAKRKRWPTSKVRAMADVLPEGPGQLDGQLDNDEGDEGDPRIPDLPHVTCLTLIVSQGIRTVANRFRVSRQYKKKPTRVPDLDLPLEDLAVNREPVKKRKKRSIAEIIFPYPNLSSFRFNYWHKKGSGKKSKGDRDELQRVLTDPSFVPADIMGVNFNAIDAQLAEDVQSPWSGNGWKKTHITLDIPTFQKPTKAAQKEKARAAATARRDDNIDPDAEPVPIHKFRIPEVHLRSLMQIIKEVVEEDPALKGFHWHAFKEFWDSPKDEVRLDDEDRRHKVEAARKLIYEEGLALNIETPKEYAARGRAEARRSQKATGGPAIPNSTAPAPSSGRRPRTFNLNTSKTHVLPDYTTHIRRYGTTDSYSTQTGELENRLVKNRHGRTSFKNVTPQLVKMDVIETVHDRMNEELDELMADKSAESATPAVEPLDVHHRIAVDQSTKEYIGFPPQAQSECPVTHSRARIRGGRAQLQC